MAVVLLFVSSAGDNVCSNNIFRVFFAEISPQSLLQFFEFLLRALNVFLHVGHVLMIIDFPPFNLPAICAIECDHKT